MTIPRIALFFAVIAACTAHGQEESGAASPAAGEAHETPVSDADSVAYFAGGCFWGVEHFMEQLDGVATVESGYMGGNVKSPTYEQVSTGRTGHLETVRVRYDSSRISYKEVAKRFFEIHDPTQADGQGPDIGPQYHSAVFYSTPEEKQVIEGLIAQLVDRGYHVVTRVEPAGTFWLAEDYHQDYYQKTGKQPYCHVPVKRFEKDAPR